MLRNGRSYAWESKERKDKNREEAEKIAVRKRCEKNLPVFTKSVPLLVHRRHEIVPSVPSAKANRNLARESSQFRMLRWLFDS